MPPPTPISDMELQDMMFDEQQEVIFARHMPEGTSNPMDLIAGSVDSRLLSPGNFEYTITMREMVVAPEFRGRGIGSWLIGRSISLVNYDTQWRPTRLMFDEVKHNMPDRLKASLVELGAHQNAETGNRVLLLPGMTVKPQVDNYDDPAHLSQIEEMVAKMPDNWNGYLKFSTEQDGRTRYYRDGTLVGMRKDVLGTYHFCRDRNMNLVDTTVYDPDGNSVTLLERTTDLHAGIFVLNKLADYL